MSDIVNFFDQFEKSLYLILAMGLLGFSIRFYIAWKELRGSIYGLEQVNAQRRLNNAAIGMFLLVLMGFIVFSLVTFVQPGIGIHEATAEVQASMEATEIEATALPTVAMDTSMCVDDPEAEYRINITSPRTNEEVRGTVEVTGIIDVDDFGFYRLEIAEADTSVWLGISVGRTLVLEESTLVVFDSSVYPPGNYVLQLVVVNHDVDEYPPCRIPIRIAQGD